ncbi:hypothetical protein [Leptolyngbya sp. FACHB-17]|uniref:hypothetical protein n=1 Tax=unclassified Leptolyngbya TaxID=2650499 RepID=UPI0016819CB3|nr:hypothetical protein [Leptolyngbya sp. FACHB-17]MBD2080803.1 hypothetical protein [Leptolyngbya sp. FACHB-17]
MFSSADDQIAQYSQGHSLFAQLRSRFPQGALISELVQIHDGQFVVRAIVQVGTTTMATGMAAAEKIEVAEDRARVRAMEVLGISPTGGATTFDVAARSMEPPKEVEPSFTTAIPDLPLPPVEALVPEIPKKTVRKKKEEPIDEVAPVPDLLSFPGLDMPEIKSASPEITREPANPTIDFASDFEDDEPELPTPEPIDLSDAIAQIGTEIERIGWTKKQGSTYLQDTYGKKTRAELDEDELIEFLHYLKALPSKGQGIPF